MPISISDYCDVPETASRLGLQVPTGLALLPRNFDSVAQPDELLHESAAATVRILFRQAGLQETRLESEGKKIPCIQENGFSLLLPTLFFAASLFAQNPHTISVALNVVSNYVYDFFRGIGGKKKVKLNIVVENDGNKSYKRISYEGDPEGIKDLKDIVGKAFKNDK